MVVINYDRPHNLARLLPALSSYAIVDEIVIAHCHPDHYTPLAVNKTVHLELYDLDKELGAGLRTLIPFTYNRVLYVDDDLLPSADTIAKLVALQDTHGEMGLYGLKRYWRVCQPLIGYTLVSSWTYYLIYPFINTILTPVLLTSKEFIVAFNAQFDQLYRAKLQDTHGNGEDLCINHFLRTHFQRLPQHVTVPTHDVVTLDHTNGYSFRAGHINARRELCRWLYWQPRK